MIKYILESKVVVAIIMLLMATVLLLILLGRYSFVFDSKKDHIRIGILHSLTGTMAESEKPLVDILLMGIDEINSAGGLLERQVEAVVVDGRSDWPHFSKEAERLISDGEVDVLFGCWTSACRKAVKPVVEKYNHLLFYPVQYEGLEQSSNIVYTGAAPNQQIVPGVNWALETFGQRIYLLGSDYIFPRAANFIINDIVNIKKAKTVAERYVILGSVEFDEIISEIKELKPDVIINTINGDSNAAFFRKRKEAGIEDVPVVSFSVAEAELAVIPDARTTSHYAVWNYFQSIKNPVNRAFIARIKNKLGSNQVVGDPMEASYIGLKLWAQAVRLAETTEVAQVLKAIDEKGLNAPEGIVSIDSRNHHLRKIVRVGKARADGQFDIIWQSKHAIRPVPYPSFRSRSDWDDIVKKISEIGAN